MKSFFLFGPRGVGKTAWAHEQFPDALFLDLLDHRAYTQLLAAPHRLADQIPRGHKGWVVMDEVQRAPDLINEVHRLIESRRLRFVLTGSSARKLRRRGVNLLAGRALTRHLHPFTALELGKDFDLKRALRWGCLPLACTSENPRDYLMSYAATYLREEVQRFCPYLCVEGVEKGDREGEAPRCVGHARDLPCQGGEELSPWKRVPSLTRLSKSRFRPTSGLCFGARFA